MNRKHAGFFLSYFAIVSAVAALLLGCGYFGTLTLVIYKPSQTALCHQYTMGLQRGRVAFWEQYQVPAPPGIKPGWHATWNGRLGLPELRRSFWEFDNHSLALPNVAGAGWSTGKGWNLYIVAFPIWCALVPFLIAPFLWAFKRRRNDTAPGFSVITQTAF